MDIKLKRLIERQFYEYANNKRKAAEMVEEIAESGLTVDFSRVFSRTNKVCRPTESKAILLAEKMQCYKWAKVVENTAVAFKFEIQGDIIRDKFRPERHKRLTFRELVEKYGSGNKSVYIYRYNKIIALALEWAIYYDLINPKKC